MESYNPKIDYCGIVDCPVENREFMCCNITGTKCPTVIISDYEDDKFEFPSDCPAKKGIIVKIKEEVK